MCTNGSNEQLCELLEYDDSKCTSIAKCCVGVHNQGDHARCTSAARKCQNFGTTWDPRRPMKPLNFEYIYNETPGYATTGKFVENFSGDFKIFDFNCILKNLIIAIILTSLLFCVMGKQLVPHEIALISLVTSMARCILF